MAVVQPIDQSAFDQWLETRPECIQKLARRLPPDRLYRMKSSGHRCTLHSYSENDTVTVNVTGQYNRVLFGRQVFGIAADDLEECDLPAPGEDVGDTSMEAGYTDDDVEKILIPQLREQMGHA